MKRDLEKLIQGTADAARAWAYASGPSARLPAEGLRPAFVAHRLVCALAELEELFAVHRTLWPQDQTWRARHGESMLDRLGSKADLTRMGAEVAEEERPDPALARSQDIGDLFEFFCQVRRSILFDGDSADAYLSARDTGSSVEAAMESVRGLDRSRRSALEQALSGFVNNSCLHQTARLPNGAVLGERYWPLFRAARLLRGETHMSIERISEILDEAEIKPETRERVRTLIDELRRVLSDYDIDRIRDILASGGQLFPGMGPDGSIVVIPGDGPGHCAPIVLAVAKGKDGRSRHGLPNVMREVRAHLIHCFEIAEVVILLTDRWDPDLMKESESDFYAHGSRSHGRKVLIPIVTWKGQITTYDWP
jgi:hypothetical protein